MSVRIQILDPTTSNQIAAGEVIERPAAAAKELIENALDAGASRIVLELEDGGRSLLRVTDDGMGMSREDAILALQRHATSKIRSADDLFSIRTMGFRGEALPSIASVSQMTVQTREKEGDSGESGAGTSLWVVGGEIQSVTDIGCPAGSSITVENLFYNVPARLKFLRSASTELSHILDWAQRLALAHPEVALTVSHHGQAVWSASGSGSLLDSCVEVFGRDLARNLLPLSHERAGIKVSGFIGSPGALKSSRSGQHAYINRRTIRNKTITRAIDEAYKNIQTLHGHKFPAAVILLEMDPSLVDVNVSPTKTEARFTRESDIFSAVYHAVSEGLLAGGLAPNLSEKAAPPSEARPDDVQWRDMPGSPIRNSFTFSPQRRSDPTEFRRETWSRAGLPVGDDPFESLPADPTTAHATPVRVSESPEHLASPQPTDYRGREMTDIRVLAQTRNRYILAQTEHALLLIDQHIAHERILYERYLHQASEKSVASQGLLAPFTLELDRRSAMATQSRLEELRAAGYELEPFGGNGFVVRSVPALLAQNRIKAQVSAEQALREIIQEITEKSVSNRLLMPQEEILISASCKMAIKSGDTLTMPEMEALVEELFQCANPYACPHGRPIIVELPNSDIDRKFGR